MAAVTICSDFGAQENKVSHCFHGFPIYLPWSDGTRCHDLHFWILSFKPAFSLCSFSFIKRLFNCSFLSAIRVVSPAYLKLLLFLPEILIPACASSSPGFHTYSACKLNKQGDSMQPWRTPLPIWNQSIVPCPVPTVASWPAYRFLRRQVRWSGIPISKNFPQFVEIHIVKGFSVVNESEVDAFLEFSCFFCGPSDVDNLISSSSAFSKSSLYIGKSLVHVLVKLSLEDFEHYFASMWNDCNCVVVWTHQWPQARKRSWVWASSGRWWRTWTSGCCSPCGHKESDTSEHLNNIATRKPEKSKSRRVIWKYIWNNVSCYQLASHAVSL